MSLFDSLPLNVKHEPLASRMRPRTLDEYVGQQHIVGPGRLLRRAIQADQISSLILYGPPGTGKTTLAMVIANSTRSHFEILNAVLAGVADVRRVTAEAYKRRSAQGQRTTLFVDEVHRWNKAQQDALLPWVENGTIILIGATTENPYFAVNRPLVSRSHVFQLLPLTPDELKQIALAALRDPERGYGNLRVDLRPEALDHLVDLANGDARGVLNALELAVETTPPNENGVIVVDLTVAEESIQRRAVLYDKEGDVHYDTISAFIKSLRGSDPDAAMYWLARMVYAGEDPNFIFRRMLIFAGEDVGLADPQAMGVVLACAQAFDRVGLPEGRFHLAEAALYLATAPKSNSAFAFFDALDTVEKEQTPDVPGHLKDASRDKDGFGHGQGYLYPHAYRDHWVAQQYLPTPLQGRVFYEPTSQGYERTIAETVARRREAQLAAMVEGLAGTGNELLTASPSDRAAERWLQRAIGGVGAQLAAVRDRILDGASLRRHDVALDLNVGTGLLTWELLRRVPEGGVWALAGDERTADGIRQQAERLPELSRPVVLVGEPVALGRLLEQRGEAAVRFDAIVGRGALGLVPDPKAFLAVLKRLLAEGGVVSLGEPVPRHGQRLYDLIDRAALDRSLVERWVAAEDAYYASAGGASALSEDELARLVEGAGLRLVSLAVETYSVTGRVDAATLGRWFGDAVPLSRRQYRDVLASALSDDEIALIHGEFRRQLLDKEVPLRTATAFLVARSE